MTDISARSSSHVTDTDQVEDQDQLRDPPAGGIEASMDAAPPRPVARGVSPDRTEADDGLFRSHIAIPQTPEASPDGKWLAYFLEGADGQTRLWLSPVDGGDPQEIELPFEPVIDRDPDTGRTIRGPQWSPDGTTIALAGREAGSAQTAIWLVPAPVSPTGRDADAVPPVDAAGDAGTTSASAPAEDDATSSDAGSGDEAGAPPDDPTVDRADGVENLGEPARGTGVAGPRRPHRLTAGTAPERSPRWSPDGATIAFVQTRDRRDVIALTVPSVDAPARTELLTWSGQDDREPVWSRDGKFLAFTRQRGDGPEHADIYVYTVATSELKNLTSEKASAIRHSLDWVPGRNLIGYVTREIDWLAISVINADNKAGWTVTRESGDKMEPRFAPKEARLLYIRTEGFATVCCERGLHASGAVALDPGEGAVFSPRWLEDKRVVYGFSAPQRPFGFLLQDNSANAERTPLPVPGEPSTVGARLRQPIPFEFEIGDDEQFSGMLYRSEGTNGPAPGIVYLPDGPLTTRHGSFQIEEQALASTGMTVLAPVLHGATGFGAGVEQDLADYADTELEVSDITEAGRALADSAGIDPAKLALVGHGYGGTLALLTAGARPGIYSAVVAIDPITDWAIELDGADPTWRTWVTRQYGLPKTNPDRYALRTPATFGAVIDVPLLLVTTASAPGYRRDQLDAFTRYLDEAGVAYERIEGGNEPVAAILRSVAQSLADRFRTGMSEEPAPSPDSVTEDGSGDA
jgi:dipeptidyl aminopeptidase/acylaminoacyl peptidase